jgi:hypothetical protein
MRAFVAISLVTAFFFAGCDPVGLRRVRVRLPQPTNDSGTIVVRQQDVQEALRVLDTVVEPLGFKAAPEQSTSGYIRVYILSGSPVTVDGRSYPRDAPIRVTQTPAGIEAAFGEPGFLGGTPEPAVRAFKDARAAFVRRYGSKNVKTKTFESANHAASGNGAMVPVFHSVRLLRAVPEPRC